jgi:ATP-dependent Clp protease ATP-binding subunit ClpC
VFENFSDSAREVVTAARTEAGRLGHEHVGTEHLLLGLLARRDETAATVLREAGATAVAARHKVAEVTGTTGAPSAEERPFTPRAQRALERAARFARQEREPRVECEHVLLGVLDVEGLGCQVLRGLNVDLAHLRDALARARTGDGPVAAPEASVEAVPPRCSSCGAALDESLAARTLHAQREAGAAKRVVVLFCSVCGTALGVVPP